MRGGLRCCCCWWALLALALTGCVHVLRSPTSPSWQALRILARAPEQYILRVEHGQGYRVGFDGLVRFEVPPLPPGQATYLFGWVKVADHRPEDAPVIQVWRSGQVVRRLSLNQLYRLPLDSDNCRLLRLK